MNSSRKFRGKPLLLVAALLGAILAAPWVSPAAGSTAAPAVAAVCSNSGWQVRANLPTDLYGGATTSDGTYAYVAGGFSFSAGNPLNTLYRYDPATNTWATLAAAPATFANASAQYSPLTNKIYVFGGETGSSLTTELNTTYIYDVATNSWSSGATMPDVRSFMASGYSNGKIFLAGGYNTSSVSSAQSQTWIYNPGTNSFSTGASMPHALGGAGSGVINGHLYVAGGRDASNTVVNTLYDYDTVGNSWSQKANMPTSANNVPGSAVVALEGKLWVFGGGSPFTPTAATRIYDPVANSWSTGPNLNVARAFIGGTAVGETIVAAGGYNGSVSVNTTETVQLTCTGTITVTKQLVSNSADPGRWDLQIDGTDYASCVGNGGTTGPVTVVTGYHTVSEDPCFSGGSYSTTITCSDGSTGYNTTSLSGVYVGPGDNVTCTIRNQRKLFKVG